MGLGLVRDLVWPGQIGSQLQNGMNGVIGTP